VSTDESIQTGDKRLETGAFASKTLNISNPISTKLSKIINFQIVWLASLYSGEIAFGEKKGFGNRVASLYWNESFSCKLQTPKPLPSLVLMKKLVLLLIIACSSTGLYCQMLPFHRYTSRDGLVADRITAIHQDSDGVMWFGSFFGLCYYDGINFSKLQLPFSQQNKYVTSITSLKDKVYAGFLFGGGLVEYKKGKIHSYSLASSKGTSRSDIIALGNWDDTSILVVSGENEIFRFANGKFHFVYSLKNSLLTPSIRTIIKDASNNIWAGSESGMWVIPPGATEPSNFFPQYNVVSLIASPRGKIWIALSGRKHGSVITCDGFDNGTLKNLNVVLNLPGLSIPGFQGNLNRGLWVVHTHQGLFNISSEGKVRHYPSALNLYADVKALYADRENNLWIANDPGLIKISNFSSVSWYFDEAAAAGGYVLSDTNGITWINNAKQLYRIRNDSLKKVDFRGTDSGYIGKMLFDSSHHMWMVRWDEGIWKTKWMGDRLSSKNYFSKFGNKKLIGGALNLDHEGNLWFAGANGIFRMREDRVMENFYRLLPSGNPLFVNVIIRDPHENVLWLGDNADGLVKVRYKIKKDGHYEYSMEKVIGPAEGLKDSYIRSMLLDHKGDLWIGTRAGGIYKMSTANENYHVEAMTPPGGISCSRITSIVEEEQSAIWFASCDGIYRFDHRTKLWQHYSVSDGLQSAEVFHMAVDAANQQVWATTELGVTRIDLDVTVEQPVPPLVHIREVNVLGKTDTAALIENVTRKYEYARNSVGFVFAGSSFLNEKNIRYKYMLEGYDKQWSSPVTTNAVNYASLAPGQYTFKVLASNARGQWSEQPASFQFEIILPFYRRPWFIFSCIVFAGAVFYLIRVDRLQHQYEVEKIRLRIARDLHDDIGSALGSINLMSETANRRLAKNGAVTEVAETFNKIGNSAQTTLESMDDIIWSINPDKDRIEDLLIRMREYAIPLLEAKDIAFEFKVNAADYKKLPMNLRKNVFLIFKEAIYNIIKHADCSRVVVVTEIKNNGFHLDISDDGKGFDPDAPTQRNGVRNMEKRAAMIGGTLKIARSERGGTTLQFRCLIK